MATVPGPAPIPTPRSAATQTPPDRISVPAAAGGQYTLPTQPDPLQAQALTEAQNAILPQVQSNAAQQAAAAARTVQSQQTAQNAYDQLAGILKGISPVIGQAYHGAAVDQAAFARGLEQGLAHIQSQAAGQTNQQLGAGTPQAAQAAQALGGQGAQNALYALGGYIPASGLAREGAGFQAAAAQLPATAAGLGLQQVQALGAKQALTDAGFDAKQSDLIARVPGLAQTALDHLTAAKNLTDYRAATLKQGDEKIAAAGKAADALANYRADTLHATQNYRQIKVDQTDSSNAATWTRTNHYLSNPDGSPRGGRIIPSAGWHLAADGTLVADAKPGKSSPVPGFGGLSASGLRALRSGANNAALAGAKGTPPSEHWAPGATTPTPYGGTPPTPYSEMVQQVFTLGPHTSAWAREAVEIVNGHYPFPQQNPDGSFNTTVAYRPFEGAAAIRLATETARHLYQAGTDAEDTAATLAGLNVLPDYAIQKAIAAVYRPTKLTWGGVPPRVPTGPAGPAR